jgi:hypothetical protein
MLPAMSFLDRVRSWFAGPPRVQTGDEEDAAALREEFGTPDAGKEDVEQLEYGMQGGPVPGLAGRDAAEIAESEIDSEEPPPGPGP